MVSPLTPMRRQAVMHLGAASSRMGGGRSIHYPARVAASDPHRQLTSTIYAEARKMGIDPCAFNLQLEIAELGGPMRYTLAEGADGAYKRTISVPLETCIDPKAIPHHLRIHSLKNARHILQPEFAAQVNTWMDRITKELPVPQLQGARDEDKTLEKIHFLWNASDPERYEECLKFLLNHELDHMRYLTHLRSIYIPGMGPGMPSTWITVAEGVGGLSRCEEETQADRNSAITCGSIAGGVYFCQKRIEWNLFCKEQGLPAYVAAIDAHGNDLTDTSHPPLTRRIADLQALDHGYNKSITTK